LPNYEQATSTS